MGLSALTSAFATQLAPDLKMRGYKKSGPTWRRKKDDTIQVLNLQKSQWGDSFYVNIGLYLIALGEEEQPTEYRCHVRCRAERLMPEEHFEFRGLLDFTTALADSDRYTRIRALIAQYPLAWLDANSTEAALRSTLKDRTKGFFVHVRVWERLGLGTPAKVRGQLGF